MGQSINRSPETFSVCAGESVFNCLHFIARLVVTQQLDKGIDNEH